MRNPIQSQIHPLDLSALDLQEISCSVGLLSGFWRIVGTCAPDPDHNEDAVRWAYLFWSGPTSEYPVPSFGITRCDEGYRITIIDPLHLFESGRFETMLFASLRSTIYWLCQIIAETEEIALDRPVSSLLH